MYCARIQREGITACQCGAPWPVHAVSGEAVGVDGGQASHKAMLMAMHANPQCSELVQRTLRATSEKLAEAFALAKEDAQIEPHRGLREAVARLDGLKRGADRKAEAAAKAKAAAKKAEVDLLDTVKQLKLAEKEVAKYHELIAAKTEDGEERPMYSRVGAGLRNLGVQAFAKRQNESKDVPREELQSLATMQAAFLEVMGELDLWMRARVEGPPVAAGKHAREE